MSASIRWQPRAAERAVPSSPARACQAFATECLRDFYQQLGATASPPFTDPELSRVIATAGHRVLERPHRTGELGRYESVVLDPDGNRIKLTL
jgi:hypothetical protein